MHPSVTFAAHKKDVRMKEMVKGYSVVFGMTFVVNLYVLSVVSGIFGGCDSFIKGLDGLGVTAWVTVLFSGYLLCESGMRYLGGRSGKTVATLQGCARHGDYDSGLSAGRVYGIVQR